MPRGAWDSRACTKAAQPKAGGSVPTGCVDTLVRSGVGVPVGGHVSRPGVREAWNRFQPVARLDLPPKSARTGRLPFGGGRPTSDLHILVPFFATKQFISSPEAPA